MVMPLSSRHWMLLARYIQYSKTSRKPDVVCKRTAIWGEILFSSKTITPSIKPKQQINHLNNNVNVLERPSQRLNVNAQNRWLDIKSVTGKTGKNVQICEVQLPRKNPFLGYP